MILITSYEEMKKNFTEKMLEINADIIVKEKEVQVELDTLKKKRFQRELEVLKLRKKVIDLNIRIDGLRSL